MYIKPYIQKIIENNFLNQTIKSVFYSEASVQYKLAIELYVKLEIHSILECKIPKKREYLDLFFIHNDRRFGIELKYKTRAVKNSEYDFLNQGAQDNGKYDYIKDIYRLENHINNNFIDEGFAIFITNDHLYWQPARESTKVKRFDINDKKVIHGKYDPEWKPKRKPFEVLGYYEINWHQNNINNLATDAIPFNYCLVNVTKRVAYSFTVG